MEADKKPNLLDCVRNAIRVRHYSIRTEEAYIKWVRRFVLFHGKKHPLHMGEKEIGEFLTHLAVKENVAPSTQNQALSAILFLYKDVLRQELNWVDNILWAKKEKRLPVVFTKEEAKKVLKMLEGTKHIIASLIYGSGLRILEALRLRVKDLDFSTTVRS